MKAKTALFILVSLIASLLTGCVRGDNSTLGNAQNKENGSANASIIGKDGQWNGEGGCYKLRALGGGSGKVSFTAGGVDYSAEPVLGDWSVIALMRGGELMLIASSGTNRYAACADGNGGSWKLEYNSGDGSKSGGWRLVKTDKDGSELLSKELPESLANSWSSSLAAESSGNIFLMLDDTVLILDGEANIQNELSFPSTFITYLTRGGDGLVYMAESKNGESEISSLDAETGKATPLLKGSMRLREGGEGWRFLYDSADGLYGIPLDSVEAEPIALWWECGISQSGLWPVVPLPGGSYLLSDGSELYLLEPAEPSEIPQKTVLTIAQVTAWGGIGSAISDFNMQSDKYFIRQIDYSDGNYNYSEEKVLEATLKLNTELIAGKHPDLIDFTSLNPQFYAQQGYLEDIYGLLDADAELERGDFVFLDKLESDGKLYYASSRFNIETALGLYSRFGDRYGWTFDEYLAIESESSSEVIYNMTAETFLASIVPRHLPSAIDWASGICDFESDSFIAILEAAKRVRENPESTNPGEIDFTPGETRLRNGSLIAILCWVDSVWKLAKAESDVGERVSYVGWPTPDGDCGSTLIPASPVGICSRGNTEGAWEFLKFLLTREVSPGMSLPAYRPELEKAISEALDPSEPDYIPNPDHVPDDQNLGNLIPVKPQPLMTRADVDRLYALIDRIDCVSSYDHSIMNIISEEFSYYLVGEKTAQETARLIQSRVSILIAERS